MPRPHLTLRVRAGAVMFDCGPCETSAGVRPVVAFGSTHIAWLAGARGPLALHCLCRNGARDTTQLESVASNVRWLDERPVVARLFANSAEATAL